MSVYPDFTSQTPEKISVRTAHPKLPLGLGKYQKMTFIYYTAFLIINTIATSLLPSIKSPLS